MKKKVYIFILIIIIAITLRLWGVETKYPGIDENHTVRLSAESITSKWYENSIHDSYPPLYYMSHGIVLLIYHSPLTLRVLTVILSIATLYLLWKLTKKVYDTPTAIITTALIAIHPMHVIYGQHPRPYTLMMVLLLGSLYIIIKWLETKENKYLWILNGIFIVSFYTHYYLGFMIAAETLYIFLTQKREIIKKYVKWLSITGIAVILWTPMFLKQYAYMITQSKISIESLTLETIPYPFYKFAIMLDVSTMLTQFVYLIIPTVIVSGIFIYGLYKMIQEKEKLILYTFIGIIILALITGIVIPTYSFRYLSYLLPLYLLITTRGMQTIRNKKWRMILLGIIILSWMSVNIYYYSVMDERLWRDAIAV